MLMLNDRVNRPANGRLAARLAFVLLTLQAAAGAHGEALSRSEQTIANFSFASQLGSGIYSVNGRTIQIYRLPLSWDHREPGPSQTGIRFLMPLTLGFYDFNLEDVLQTQLPRSIDTLSFVPGVEFSRIVHKDWLASAFVQGGIAKERTSTADAYTYAFGLGADRRWDFAPFRMHFNSQLLYAAALFKDRPDDSMVRWSNALEARAPFRRSVRGVPLDYGLYALNEWYLRRPDPPLATIGAPITAVQWELGVTVGAAKPVHLWKIPLPRLGIGYRFGDSLSVVRIVFGAPF
jgi:hypothetical protein